MLFKGADAEDLDSAEAMLEVVESELELLAQVLGSEAGEAAGCKHGEDEGRMRDSITESAVPVREGEEE